MSSLPPTFSIVIATYNASAVVSNCLESLRKQTYRSFEILIADGLSTDGTLEIINRHRGEITFLTSERDAGIYDAWNKLLPHTRGEWTLFLGADDLLWENETLEKVSQLLGQVSENVAYGRIAVTMGDGTILNFEGAPWAVAGKKFRHEMTIPHQGTFHRKKLFSEHGTFDPSFRICGDYEFLLRELKNRSPHHLDLVIARMAFGGLSSTYKNVPIIIRELTRARKTNGVGGFSPYIFLRWTRYYLRISIRALLGSRAEAYMADFYRRAVGKPNLWTIPRLPDQKRDQ